MLEIRIVDISMFPTGELTVLNNFSKNKDSTAATLTPYKFWQLHLFLVCFPNSLLQNFQFIVDRAVDIFNSDSGPAARAAKFSKEKRQANHTEQSTF